jgi:hypothetical protein
MRRASGQGCSYYCAVAMKPTDTSESFSRLHYTFVLNLVNPSELASFLWSRDVQYPFTLLWLSW